MLGTVIIIIVLVTAPVGILMSSTVFVGVFSKLLNDDVDETHEGSELLELAESGVSVAP